MEGTSGSVIAVLALYRGQADAFTKDHLHVLQVVSAKLGQVVESKNRVEATTSPSTPAVMTAAAGN